MQPVQNGCRCCGTLAEPDEVVTATEGNVVSEVEAVCSQCGEPVGFWAHGHWHHDSSWQDKWT